MSIMDLNEQELFRRESLAKLRELGIEPYPAALYPINTSAEDQGWQALITWLIKSRSRD